MVSYRHRLANVTTDDGATGLRCVTDGIVAAKAPGKCHHAYGQSCAVLLVDYQALLKRHNLSGSMSAKGCCYVNACAENFLHSLKVECIHGECFASREIMRMTVFNYIECDYNRWRRHSTCCGLSAEQFENQNLA